MADVEVVTASRSLLCVWPVLDPERERDRLIVEAECTLDQLAAEQGARIPANATITWRTLPASELPGWEWHDGLLLVATVKPAHRVGPANYGPDAAPHRIEDAA